MEEKFGVVVAIGLTFFGLMLIAAQDVDIGLNLGGGEQKDRLVMVSENLGEIGEAHSDIRTSNIGSFSIGEGRGDVQVHRADRLELSNSLLSGKSLEFTYNATQPDNANISFEVLGKEGSGAFYVEANGERVLERRLISGATENVKVDGESLVPGVNRFKVGVTKGGLFSSTRYVLEDFRATVNDRKFSDYRDSFEMYGYELQDYGFVGANLSFTIPVDSAVVTEPLEVYVNGNKIFDSVSVRSRQSIAIPREAANLHPGYNTVSFETEADARYRIENAQITVQYIGRTSPSIEQIDFSLNGSDMSFIRRDDTDESIDFKYQIVSGNREIYLELGSFNRTITPVNGQNSIEVPETAFSRGENTLEIQGSGSFTMNDLKVVSEVSQQ